MLGLFTDFGSHDLYVGQLKAAIWRMEPALTVIDLLHDAPDFGIEASAHLLAALHGSLPAEVRVIVAVVDPGVGGARRPVVIRADERWLVGPDIGLLSVVAQRAMACQTWSIEWRPQVLSQSFHGRDLFGPVAAMLASGSLPDHALVPVPRLDILLEGVDQASILYVDHYGNAMTGLRAATVAHGRVLEVAGVALHHARVFEEVPPVTPFWYQNSLGLVEIAVCRGSAALQLGLRVGLPVTFR